MPRIAPVGKIRRLADWVEDITVVFYVRLWYHGHDGSLWFNLSAVTNITPGYVNINTTIQNPDGEVVPVTVSWYGFLLEVDGGWLNSGVHKIRCVSPETFPKRSDKWWYWQIVEVSFEMRGIWSLISCNFLLFARNFSILFLTFGSIILLAFVSIVLLASTILLAIILLFYSFLS